MLLTRTDSAMNILDELVRQDLFECQSLDDSGNWIPVTNRSILYAGLINELILEAQREGLVVRDDFGGNLFDERTIESVYCSPEDNEPCDTIVYDGTPIDLDTHEFTDDCERVDGKDSDR